MATPQRSGSITVRQLEAFRALMLAGTTIGAAGLLGVSQPNISRLIAQLEADLKFLLFDRSRGRLIATPEALMLYEEVDRAFDSVDKIMEVAKEIGTANAGRISMACIPALALGFMPRAIERFRAIHPRVSISLTIQASSKVEVIAATQQIDFGIAEYPFVRSGIETEDFFRSRLQLAVPPGHRLASYSNASPRDVEGESFISLSRATVGRHLIDNVFSQARVSRRMQVEAQFAAAIAALVLAGQGVGLIDPFTAFDFRGRGLKCLAFEPAIEFRVGLLYPSHRALSRSAREFVRLLKSMLGEVLGSRAS